MLNWNKCNWSDKVTRPTVPGLYRVVLAGFCDSEDGYITQDIPDYQEWADLHPPYQKYKLKEGTIDILGDQVPDGDPYQIMAVQHGCEEDSIIAWHGPIHIPDSKLWQPTEEDKPETRPPKVGWYRVMIVGDSETDGPHVYYEYNDYEIWAEVKGVDEDGVPDIRCEFDEEPDWIMSWYGPINIPEVDCFDV